MTSSTPACNHRFLGPSHIVGSFQYGPCLGCLSVVRRELDKDGNPTGRQEIVSQVDDSEAQQD